MAAIVDDLNGLPRMEPELEKKPQAQRLVEFVPDEALFRSTDGETAFATVSVGDHEETWPVRSKGMRRWLVAHFYLEDHKPPSAQALTDALGALEAKAQFGGRVHDVHVRLAGAADAIYLDLANAKWEVVEITAHGWDIISAAPVKFRRSKGMLPLPRPVASGTVADLRPFVNVRDDAQWALLVAWTLAALRPVGPYPVLNLSSEHGSGKTTTGEVLRRLIDPNSAMLRAEPRDVRDVMIAATNSWMVAFDNLSQLEPWLSDCLCRLSTGGGFSTRELYSDMDEMIFSAQRPAVLNGIEEVIDRGDLLDRAILLDLPPIAEDRRLAIGDFWRRFDAARPQILGALLTAVSTALHRAPHIRLARLPRMADFAIWTEAAAPALGWAAGYFLGVYTTNREHAHESALDASPVAAVVRALADKGRWEGTASELLAALTSAADDFTKKARSWPTTPRYLGAVLRRLAPNLRAVAVMVEFVDKRELGARRRQIILYKTDLAAPDQADQLMEVNQRSQRTQRSDGALQDDLAFPGTMHRSAGNDGGNDGPQVGNAENPLGNERNDGNDLAPVLTNGDQEGEL